MSAAEITFQLLTLLVGLTVWAVAVYARFAPSCRPLDVRAALARAETAQALTRASRRTWAARAEMDLYQGTRFYQPCSIAWASALAEEHALFHRLINPEL